ncbi:MAG: carboxypeptidase-like regulatory domain-containing protein [Odoribacter sp.]
MNKRFFSLIILILSSILSVNAQDDSKIIIKGTVINAQTGEPIAFANMGVLGTVAGVASDMEGRFELSVPDKYATNIIRVSAVGYAGCDMKVYEAKAKPDLKIALKPVTYAIGAVDVHGQLLIYKKMIQNVVSNILKNYISKPYSYDGYFKYKTNVNGEEKVKEAIVTLYDSKGYHRKDVASAFQEQNYHFSEVRRSQELGSVLDGLTYFDDILTADIVRNTRNVLDIVNSRDYKLKNKGKLIYEGDSVQIIAYNVVNPSISTTGDPSVQTYNGEIYINQKDMAVLKNVINITSRNFNILGRNLVTINEQSKSDVKMTITTTYKKLKSIYFLSGVTIEYTYKEADKEIKGEMEYVTTRVNIETPTPIKGRMYYEDIKKNEDFWKGYTVYFEN